LIDVRPTGRWVIVGGAGFIGGHFVDRLLAEPAVSRVTVYDNFSSGRPWHLEPHAGDDRLRVVHGEVADLEALSGVMEPGETVVHLASNPDIAAAMNNPDIDFVEGTALTRNVIESMRRSGASRILYASGSGVYGDVGEHEATEDDGPMIPTSTYGASKLSGEAIIASYTAMFDITGCVFRFGNVVGSRQTHGVALDFARKLLNDPTRLDILGDGNQSKSYIHVFDVLSAVLTANERTTKRFEAYNVATGDYITVREIAELAVTSLGLDPATVRFEFAGGTRGWKGDVPIVRLNTARIRSLGWECQRTSQQALEEALHTLIRDLREGRL
jgi:UDP-glucose 4-epimerase